ITVVAWWLRRAANRQHAERLTHVAAAARQRCDHCTRVRRRSPVVAIEIESDGNDGGTGHQNAAIEAIDCTLSWSGRKVYGCGRAIVDAEVGASARVAGGYLDCNARSSEIR